MFSSRHRLAFHHCVSCRNTRSRAAETDAVIIAEINAAIRVSSASIGVRGVSNREKRAWCANIELEGPAGRSSSLSLSPPFFSLPLEWGASLPFCRGVSLPHWREKYNRSCRYTRAITGHFGPSKYHRGVEVRRCIKNSTGGFVTAVARDTRFCIARVRLYDRTRAFTLQASRGLREREG